MADEGRRRMAVGRVSAGSCALVTLFASIVMTGCGGGMIQQAPPPVPSAPAAAQINTNPTSLAFGSVNVGSTATRTVAVSNSGGSSLTITQANVSGSAYRINGLALPVSLAAGQSVNVTVAFTPAGGGSASGNVSFLGAAGTSPATVSLSGSGVAGSGQLAASPSSVAFGNLLVGNTSTQQVTLANSGTSTVTISQINVAGTGYGVSGLALPRAVAAGQSATFNVAFAPTAAGQANGSVSVVSDAGNAPATISLTGNGTQPSAQPQLSISSSSASFGNVIVGNTNTSVLILSNTGTPSLTISQSSVSGAGFAINGPTFPLTLASGERANLTVAFAPSAAGSASGSASLTSNDPNSPTPVALSGNGVAATRQLTVSPASLSFVNVPTGSNRTLPVTLSNTGNSDVTISQLSVTGADFTTSGLAASQIVPPGQSTSFSVQFTPTAIGSANGSVTVTSNASNSPSTIGLSGSAITPSIAGSPVCGQLDDQQVHTPPNYTSLLAPLRGQPFNDPQFGCSMTRLTDSALPLLGSSAHHQYSTISAMNRDGSYVSILLENSQKLVVDTSGNVVVGTSAMPGTNSPQLPWDRNNPNIFYYSSGNRLMRATINGPDSVSSAVVRAFANFSTVRIPDQTDLSDDGTKVWLIGNPGNECAGTAIAYDLSADTVLSQSLTLNSCHKVQTFPSGKMLCTNCNGMQVTIYNTDGSIYWNVPTQSAHADVGTDLQGREVLIHTANGNTSLNACSDAWASLSVIDINTRQPVNCLIDRIPAWHVSYRSLAGWAVVSTFDHRPCPSYSCFSLSSNWAAAWPGYGEELVLVKIDGSEVRRLAHHRSRTAQYYWAQPRASLSLDGRYVVFDSNFGLSLPLLNFTDVYLMRVIQ